MSVVDVALDLCDHQQVLLRAMALIEGIGDEVTLLFSSLLLILVLLLAWISTRTSEPPDHLFASAPGPSPSAQQEVPSSFSDSNSSSANGGLLTEAAPTDASRQEEKDEGGGTAQAAGGGGGRLRQGDGVGESSSSQRNMVVRLKFLNDTERTAQVQPQDTIGYIKR